MIRRTSRKVYRAQGAGIGTGAEAFQRYPPSEKSFVLDIGFGDCSFVKRALELKCLVFGVDIAEASIRLALAQGLIHQRFCPLILDVSHQELPFLEDFFDYIYCLETIEHLSNPFYAFAEVKRVLKHKGKFIITHPMPEKNLGYEAGKHAHLYPGLCLRDSFLRFMQQLYFKLVELKENGDTAWYLFENIKEGGELVDPFFVLADNFTEDELYGWLEKMK